MQINRKLIQVALGLILFITLPAVAYLSDTKRAGLFILNGTDLQFFFSFYQPVIFVIISGLFLVNQFFLHAPKRASTEQVKQAELVVHPILQNMLVDYYDCLINLDDPNELDEDELPSVRSNMMLITRKYVLQERLQIKFDSSVLDNEENKMLPYSKNDFTASWKRGECVWGDAWKLGKTQVGYLPHTPPEYTRGKKSVLSLPIWDLRGTKVIGVLNLESNHDIHKTKFADLDVRNEIEEWTTQFSYLMTPFRDGVDRVKA